MTPKTLRVRLADRSPAAPPLVQNHEALERGINKFIGARYDAAIPAFVPTGEVEEIPYRAEYAHALTAGDLVPADKATADVVGLPFGEAKKDGETKKDGGR
jgi:hypothetical protein